MCKNALLACSALTTTVMQQLSQCALPKTTSANHAQPTGTARTKLTSLHQEEAGEQAVHAFSQISEFYYHWLSMY